MVTRCYNVGTITTSSTSDTWFSWNNDYILSDTTWANWTGINNTTVTNVYYPGQVYYVPPVEPQRSQAEQEYVQAIRDNFHALTERERAELAAMREQNMWDERNAEQRRQRELAGNKAEELLLSLLTEEQKESRQRNNYFDLKVEGGNKPARHYRIYKGTSGNIRRLEDGKEVESLCVLPSGVPSGDVHVAQLLHLMHNEEEVVKLANKARLAA